MVDADQRDNCLIDRRISTAGTRNQGMEINFVGLASAGTCVMLNRYPTKRNTVTIRTPGT
jgi:hypothetical protein